MKVIIVDDHPVVRQGIRSILEFEKDIKVCGEAEDGSGALKLAEDTSPDLAIVDIELKGNVNGLELVKALKERYPRIISLVMSMDDGTIYAERSMKAGARGYIAKEEASDKIIEAIRCVMEGDIYIQEKISKRIMKQHLFGVKGSDSDNVGNLSNRELEIFKLIGQGYKRNEIARKISININTVESHRRKIKEKLQMKDSSELAKFAVQWFVQQKG